MLPVNEESLLKRKEYLVFEEYLVYLVFEEYLVYRPMSGCPWLVSKILSCVLCTIMYQSRLEAQGAFRSEFRGFSTNDQNSKCLPSSLAACHSHT